MTEIGEAKRARHRIWWVVDGPGGHGDEPQSPDAVTDSISGRFRFAEQTENSKGLRAPQIGALHAMLAERSMESDEPMTIVLPTGTGKTETMLAAWAHTPAPTLVICPSDNLRSQIAEKFATLGVLPDQGVVEDATLRPVVGLVKSALNSQEDIDELLDQCNVLISTAASISKSSPEAVDRLAERCLRLFIDEAHHVAADTWREIADSFAHREVVQFTATPFREDGKHLGGRVIYAYPLKLAQERGYFAPITYRAVFGHDDPDSALAEAAVEQLRRDRSADLDHVLMARVRSIPRAEDILALYQNIAPEFSPVRIDSKMSLKRQRLAFRQLESRETRIVVCVDMLGEGFDLQALKIAAVHDLHKSLAVTLQFIGRFARSGDSQLGEASMFVPRLTGDVDDRLLRLYGEDSDWNDLVRDLTHAEVEREQERSDFERSFGSLPAEVAIRSVQPKMSTVVYKGDSLDWRPSGVYDVYHESELLTKTVGVSSPEQVLWFVTAETSPVRWTDFSTFSQVVHNLFVICCDDDVGLLYLNSSDNSSVHRDLARAIGGEGVELISGPEVYRILDRVNRRVPTNVGLLDTVNRNRRFSMHVGADVLEGFGPTAAQKSKTNIFAHGYSRGSRVSFGASLKGRVWSHRAARNLYDWVTWAKSVGPTLLDESISVESVMEGFVIPVAAVKRPNLVPLGVEWPYDVIGTTSESRVVSFQDESQPLIDLDLEMLTFSESDPIGFAVVSDTWRLEYEVEFNEEGPRFRALGDDATIELASGTMRLETFMTDRGMTIFFEQEATLGPDGYLIQPDRDRAAFSIDRLEAIDWTGVDIRRESQGPERDPSSIQHRVAEVLGSEEEWEIVIDDDGKGEVADLVFLRRSGRTLYVQLAHCKFSSSSQPGARLNDLYEVCGQAQKSYKARNEIELVVRKLIRREQKRRSSGTSGVLVGDLTELHRLSTEVRFLDHNVTVVIAQPGASKGRLAGPHLELLGCTELFLSETYNSKLRVLCSG